MRMVRDHYTGELYDADKWYRGANACWVNKEAEARHNAEMDKLAKQRHDRLNESRVSRGKKRRSPYSFARASRRYLQWLRLDSVMPFGEWLKRGCYKEDVL